MRNARILLCFFTLIALITTSFALSEESIEVNDRCSFKTSTGKVEYATDEKMTSAWAPKGENATLYIRFPDEGAGFVRFDWQFDPKKYEFVQYDESRNELTRRTDADSFPCVTQVFSIDPAARFASLALVEPGQEICKVKVYSKGELPLEVPVWQPPYDKCDLMVVSTHEDDEFVFFGGIVPYYEHVMGAQVQVVYMANCGRLRRAEALNGLWAVGMRRYPEFLNLPDKRVETIGEGVELWGGKEKILSELVTRIRRFRPEVILTHDLDGEYGHNQHKITANAMKFAIEAAADPAQFPDSAAEFGAWQVKKLYLHLLSDDVIDFDWNAPYEELGGLTPLDVARLGYSMHTSQQQFYSVQDGGQYDNSLFGLAFSQVGEDVRHDDLFENIPGFGNEESPLIPAFAEETPAPSPEPATVVTAEPSAAVATSASPAPEAEESDVLPLRISLIAAALAATLLAVGYLARLLRHSQKGKKKG